MAAFVYVIEADNGDVKVGLSVSPYARLSQVKRDYRGARGFTDARLVGFVKSDAALEVEAMAHQALQRHVIPTAGEWYRVDPLKALIEVLWQAMEFDPGAFVRWSRP